MPTPPVTTTGNAFTVESQPASAIGSQPADAVSDKTHAPDHSSRQADKSIRDAGVSDAIWNRLQKDAQNAEEERRECRRLVEEEETLRQWLEKCADAKRQRELQELEEKLRREAQAQEKLATMGVCPAGFQWTKQGGGYRCAGGAHFVSDGQMQKMCG
jgi:hypothetical protein